MKWLKWFIAGFLAVPLFHHVVLFVCYRLGWIARKPYSFAATAPFGVPEVISLSFWGGVWGLLLGAILERTHSAGAYWSIAIVFGAIAPTLVAGLVVMPLKGLPRSNDPKLIVTGLLVNAAWGLGTALLRKLGG